MTNPTTPFSWQMPTSTDLVTDLPADFETFGQAVATSMADLLGGTTGQVLSKTSNTNMDFTWVTPQVGDITAVTAGTGLSGGGTGGDVTLSINTAVTADLTTAQTLTNKTLTSPALTTPTISTLTTNGDLLYGTGSGAIARRAIGTTGQVLTVSGGLPNWATPATPTSGLTYITGATFSSVASASMPNDTFTSTYNNYKVILNVTGASGVVDFAIRYRASGADNTTTTYRQAGANQNAAGGANNVGASGLTSFSWGNIDSGNASNTQFEFTVMSPKLAQYTTTLAQGTYSTQSTTTMGLMFLATTQFDAMTFFVTSGTFSGSYRVYGIANS